VPRGWRRLGFCKFPLLNFGQHESPSGHILLTIVFFHSILGFILLFRPSLDTVMYVDNGQQTLFYLMAWTAENAQPRDY
jgi:hypothetical protein